MRRALVLLTTCLTLAAAPAALAAPANDNYADAEEIPMDDWVEGDNAGATVLGGEPLTTQATAWCDDARGGVASPDGWPMRSTIWYFTRGTGATLTTTAWGPGIDSVMAVYAVNPNLTRGPLLKCNDHVPSVFGAVWSGLRFQSQRDQLYAIQVGSACNTPIPCNLPVGHGKIFTDIATQPRDDDPQHASRLEFNKQDTESLFGATEDPNEQLSCGDSEFGKTRWFRVTAPAVGTLSVSATGPDHDSVINLYQADGRTRLDCNDDDEGSSSSSARVSVMVNPGEYLVQVGGYGRGPSADSDTNFVLNATFAENTDVDGDGVGKGTDCNDNNAAIRPGALEITDNGIDDNCDGREARDTDDDGFAAVPDGPDCNDANAQIRPGVRDAPDNKVDENCDGVDGKRVRVQAQPKFRYRFEKGPARLQVVEAWVEHLDAGSTVTLTCSGRGCPTKRAMTKTVTKKTKSLKMNVRFKHRLRRAASITLTITHGDDIGTVRRLVVGNRKVEDQSLCLWPGEKRARACN